LPEAVWFESCRYGKPILFSPSFRLAITKNRRHSWTNCLVPSKYVAM
jgi:hypothetical protein